MGRDPEMWFCFGSTLDVKSWNKASGNELIFDSASLQVKRQTHQQLLRSQKWNIVKCYLCTTQSLIRKYFNLLSEDFKKPSDMSMCLNDTKYKGFKRNINKKQKVIYLWYKDLWYQLFNIFFSFLYNFVICVFVIFSSCSMSI